MNTKTFLAHLFVFKGKGSNNKHTFHFDHSIFEKKKNESIKTDFLQTETNSPCKNITVTAMLINNMQSDPSPHTHNRDQDHACKQISQFHHPLRFHNPPTSRMQALTCITRIVTLSTMVRSLFAGKPSCATQSRLLSTHIPSA